MQIEKVSSLKNSDIEKVSKIHRNLTIQEFINVTNFDIDLLFVDKFWSSIKDDKPILVDDEIIRWLTKNQNGVIRHGRKTIKDKIIQNKLEYKIIDYESLKTEVMENSITWKFEIIDEKSLKQIEFIFLYPDSFRELCMLSQTEKGK